jgi:hypothetical protein
VLTPVPFEYVAAVQLPPSLAPQYCRKHV